MENHFEQLGNSLSFQQLDICCKKIAEKVGDKPISDWTNSDYVKLSGLLLRKTRVHLSENTLKRIFRKQKTASYYYPQKATRDTLAQFIGYRDWYEFELLNPVAVKATIQPDVQKSDISETTRPKTIKKKWLYLIPLLIIIIAVIFLITRKAIVGDIELKNVTLNCINPIGETPLSAFFKLKVNGRLPDSAYNFSVDFNDEVSTKPKRTSFRNNLVNHYYEVPGRYYPLLYYKDRLIDTAYVYLQTHGWTATCNIWHDTTRAYPILKPGIAKNKIQNISASDVFKAGVDTNRTFFIHYDNIKPTHINGDNFELSINITGSRDRPGVRCAQADISIFGENDKHYLGLIKPQCVIWNVYQFSENHKDGEKDDLRALGYDLSKGAEVTLRVENKNVKVMIGSKEIYKTSYSQSIGKIMGVEVYFSGIGSFENLMIRDLKTGEKF